MAACKETVVGLRLLCPNLIRGRVPLFTYGLGPGCFIRGLRSLLYTRYEVQTPTIVCLCHSARAVIAWDYGRVVFRLSVYYVQMNVKNAL